MKDVPNMNHHWSASLEQKKNKHEALKLNLFKQLEEQDMVHQRELQQKEEHFYGELKRHEQELPEVEERMRELLCHQHESFQKLLHKLSEQLKARVEERARGEDPEGPRGSMKTDLRTQSKVGLRSAEMKNLEIQVLK